MAKKISIVTPSYNHGKYISETIESVISQAGDFYIDYIIADGGSSDDTVEVINKYETLLKDGRYPIKCKGVILRWWSKKDKGQSDAINQGLKIATGDIFAYLNSDDSYTEGAFQHVVDVYADNISLYYGDLLSFWNDGSKNLVNTPPANITYKVLISNGPLIFQPSSFWLRSAYEQVGGFGEDLHYGMDYDYFIRLLRQGKSKYIPFVLAKFRVIDGQKSSDRKKLDDEFLAINKKYSNKLTWYQMKKKIKGMVRL